MRWRAVLSLRQDAVRLSYARAKRGARHHRPAPPCRRRRCGGCGGCCSGPPGGGTEAARAAHRSPRAPRLQVCITRGYAKGASPQVGGRGRGRIMGPLCVCARSGGVSPRRPRPAAAWAAGPGAPMPEAALAAGGGGIETRAQRLPTIPCSLAPLMVMRRQRQQFSKSAAEERRGRVRAKKIRCVREALDAYAHAPPTAVLIETCV